MILNLVHKGNARNVSFIVVIVATIFADASKYALLRSLEYHGIILSYQMIR